ncbi:MAG: zinc ABC transporter substrate-binding protein [Microvirga sp.]|nr:zinc ABC transporter substrate-binding protein [Microvirga sp.]
MTTRRNIITLLSALILAGATGPAVAQGDRLPVVATFSILGDLVTNVGGDRVSITTLVGPDGDGHVYSPSPADARLVADARVIFANGLLYEGWIDRLIASSGTQATIVAVSDGASTIAEDDDDGHEDEHADEHGHDHEQGHDHGHGNDHAHGHDHAHDHDEHAHDHAAHEAEHAHGAFDPHAWQDVANVKVYVANIRDALIEADPAGADVFRANADRYLADLAALDAEIRETAGALPEGAAVVTSHDAFRYFSRAYGVAFAAPQGVSTESEASARDVAELTRLIRERDIKAVFAESMSDARLIERIAAEANVPVAGTLYSDALSGADGPAPTYIEMMRHNIRTISAGLSS